MKKVVIYSAAIAAMVGFTSCAGGSKSTITKGSLETLDSLSYALGANVAYSVQAQLGDIPFNYELLAETVGTSALGKTKMSQEDAITVLQEYFMTKREPRLMEVEKLRDTADSIAIANGAKRDVVVAARAEMPADESMFVTVAEKDSVSYAFGIDLGSNIKSSQLPAQAVWLEQSLLDVLVEGEALMTAEEAAQYVQNYFTVTLPQQNAEASEAWLAEAAKANGAQVTESGIVYKIIKQGDMTNAPTLSSDEVKVAYTGKTRTGKTFDTSRFKHMSKEQKEMYKQYDPANYGKDRDAQFRLSGVIQGWQEGIKLIGEGGRIQLWIPSNLAYGSRGAGQNIGANEALFFDIELFEVMPYQNVIPSPTK